MSDDTVPETEPFVPFARWFELANASEPLAEAMIVATTTPEGRPSARALLLKGVDPRGFVFYTNFESRKAEELLGNPQAALCFHWKSLGRQVRIEGTTEIVTPEEADAYFASRPRESRLGAWASAQSRPLDSRDELARAFATVSHQYPEPAEVPRPPNWSGFRLIPEAVEFWQDRPHRLHDRVVFRRSGRAWQKQRLYP
ncbi:MAG: pyridoxamine 5'-phosphate oxidase [Alphaproteobacteria bacterium]|nr:pyridoxamine 5'-phosphate oxidase [Alphaproteobacteria bacterium]